MLFLFQRSKIKRRAYDDKFMVQVHAMDPCYEPTSDEPRWAIPLRWFVVHICDTWNDAKEIEDALHKEYKRDASYKRKRK
jgi:hypothetical protein